MNRLHWTKVDVCYSPMMMSTIKTLLTLVFLVCLLGLQTDGSHEKIQCYSCKSGAGLPYSEDCAEPSERTHFITCSEDTTACKKRVVSRQGNVTVVERSCDDNCNQQTGINMMPDIQIDTYCCETDLCNTATRPGQYTGSLGWLPVLIVVCVLNLYS